jgi:hypothetical protein
MYCNTRVRRNLYNLKQISQFPLIEVMEMEKLLSAFVSNPTPNQHLLQNSSFQQSISKLTLKDVDNLLNQLLKSKEDHRKLLLSMYSWDLFDQLFTCIQREPDNTLTRRCLVNIFTDIPMKEIEIMVLEKFSIARSTKEIYFLIINIEIVFSLERKFSIDFAVKCKFIY